MIKIGKTYHFEAAHQLPRVPATHKCASLHGHNYKVEVELIGELDARGFVVDFFELDVLMQPLLDLCDHQYLNDVIVNPTAENIALWFLQQLPAVERVRVYERDDCWAEATHLSLVPARSDR